MVSNTNRARKGGKFRGEETDVNGNADEKWHPMQKKKKRMTLAPNENKKGDHVHRKGCGSRGCALRETRLEGRTLWRKKRRLCMEKKNNQNPKKRGNHDHV